MKIENIFSFVDDNRGRYLMATDNGLFSMNYDMGNLTHFSYGEGLDCRLITSAMKFDRRGTLWVGTSNGLMYMEASALSRWEKSAKFKIMLYDIYESGKAVNFPGVWRINDNHEISLSWNIVSRRFSAKPIVTDFARPYGRLYEYRVDGDSEWKRIQDGEGIRLAHLFLGGHTLEVRLAGVSGTTATYRLWVYPSVMAIIELLLVIIAGVIFLLWHRYRSRTNRLLSERDDIEQALIEVEEEQEAHEVRKVLAAEDPTKKKYKGIHLDDKECADIVRRMRRYMEESKVFTNPDLKMSEVAEYLHLPASKLSLVFNIYLKQNYYEFINRYRLDYFKKLLDAGEQNRFTITALSEKCGFKRSNFFSTFRKVEGMTPAEYMSKHK
jgi:AraC-like DNA-binding protein